MKTKQEMKNTKEHLKKSRDGRSSGMFYDGSAGRYVQKVFLALCVIAVGVGYLGNQVSFLPWTHFTLFFPGWGALFLIVPAIYSLLRKPFSLFWYICLLIGTMILASNWISFPRNWFSIAVAVLIIIIGLRILLNPIIRRARHRKFKKSMTSAFSNTQSCENGNSDYIDYQVQFGSRRIDMAGVDFVSSSLTVKFGEMSFDLRGAQIHDCAVIDAECSFGELKIFLPEYVKTEVMSENSFASISNIHRMPDSTDAPTVYIHAECSFGEIQII